MISSNNSAFASILRQLVDGEGVLVLVLLFFGVLGSSTGSGAGDVFMTGEGDEERDRLIGMVYGALLFC